MEASGFEVNEDAANILNALSLMRSVLTPEELLDIELSPCSPEVLLGLDPVESVDFDVDVGDDDFFFFFLLLFMFSQHEKLTNWKTQMLSHQ